MATSKIEGEGYFIINNYFYNEQIHNIIEPILPKFMRLMRSYVFFNLFFVTVISLEVLSFIAFFSILSQTSLLAFGLALFFLTLFSYFILRLYFQSKKPEQIF